MEVKLVILGHVLLFSPLWTKKIKIWIKWKNSGDIILHILHTWTENYNHMMYSSWDKDWYSQNFCHFGLFLALSPPSNPEIQKFEKVKKTLRNVICLHMCIINDSHMMHGSWEWAKRFVILDPFCPFIPLKSQKIKEKKEKNS